jgi:hypothetical protein
MVECYKTGFGKALFMANSGAVKILFDSSMPLHDGNMMALAHGLAVPGGSECCVR